MWLQMYCLVPQKKHDFFLSLPINLDIAIAQINTYMKNIFQLNFLRALPLNNAYCNTDYTGKWSR